MKEVCKTNRQELQLTAMVTEGYGSNAVDKLIFARPGVSEKGYLDVKIEVRQYVLPSSILPSIQLNTFSRRPGGHSSVPPEHTVGSILGSSAYYS